MKRLITLGLTSLVLASAYSSVYACDHTAKASKATKANREVVTTQGKTIRTLVVGATSGCPAVDPVISLDIDVPGRTSPRFIHIDAVRSEDRDTPSVFRTAMTLGRAMITTFHAVMGELIDAASEKTASIV